MAVLAVPRAVRLIAERLENAGSRRGALAAPCVTRSSAIRISIGIWRPPPRRRPGPEALPPDGPGRSRLRHGWRARRMRASCTRSRPSSRRRHRRPTRGRRVRRRRWTTIWRDATSRSTRSPFRRTPARSAIHSADARTSSVGWFARSACRTSECARIDFARYARFGLRRARFRHRPRDMGRDRPKCVASVASVARTCEAGDREDNGAGDVSEPAFALWRSSGALETLVPAFAKQDAIAFASADHVAGRARRGGESARNARRSHRILSLFLGIPRGCVRRRSTISGSRTRTCERSRSWRNTGRRCSSQRRSRCFATGRRPTPQYVAGRQQRAARNWLASSTRGSAMGRDARCRNSGA